MIKILCVDGLDFDYAGTFGLSMPYQTKLTIPKECYVEVPDHDPMPHTWLVWASMFTGQTMKTFPDIKKIPTWRAFGRHVIKSMGISWDIRTNKSHYQTNPAFQDLDNVFTPFSFTWNIPTICPEWIATVDPDYEKLLVFLNREYQMFVELAKSKSWVYDYYAIYCRLLDTYAHLKKEDLLEARYNQIFNIANLEREEYPVLLISDHGTKIGEHHTDWAYCGANFPLDNVKSILDIRKLLEKTENVSR